MTLDPDLDPNLDPDAIDATLDRAHPRDILRWASTTFGADLVVTSSFQTQSVPLLHMLSQVAPEVPVLFLDTGFHFAETLRFRDRLAHNLGLRVVTLTPRLGHDGFRRRHGALYRRDPERCCFLNKVDPLEEAKGGYRAWISGIRRDQTRARAATPVVAVENGRYKICPLATWSRRRVWRYLSDHALPEHPLLAEGYPSVGCAPCTRPVLAGEDARAGRWPGSAKTECGLHGPAGAPTTDATP